MVFGGLTRLGFVGLASIVGVVGCSDHADLPNFHDISSASAAIRTAARAVVRIETAGQVATASFISSSGLLLTNSHALGATVCAVEGCYVEISFMHQFGEPPQKTKILFAVPVAIDIGLDMATVQLYGEPNGVKFDSPDFLSFDSQLPASLLGTHVTVVGHPEGQLKKWTDGVVFDVSGDWVMSTAYILPGESGSPMLDDAGNVVGLVHSGPTAQDLFTSDGVNEYSVATASAPIMDAMTAPLPSSSISVNTVTTQESVVANNRVYLNAHAATAVVETGSVSVLSLLAQACDSALARQDFQSDEQLADALSPCDDAITWIDCRFDASPVPYKVVCPAGEDSSAWQSRFQAMNQRRREMNGDLDLYPISFGIANLASSKSEGTYAGGQSLQQAISDAQPVLDFSLALYLAAFNMGYYGNINIVDYVKAYKTVLHYEFQALYIAAAAGWLYSFQALTKTEMLSIWSQLHHDPNVSIGDKLYIEDLQYYIQ
jgi:hypothetical protein